MMNRSKKFAAFMLSLCIAVTMASATSFASATQPDPEVSVEGSGSGISTRTSYLIIDGAIATYGASWNQPAGYNAYRVWVENTTSQTMTVTIAYSGGTRTYTVPANSGKSISTVNNAWEGTHTLDFTTPIGTVSGWVTVRVSDKDL